MRTIYTVFILLLLAASLLAKILSASEINEIWRVVKIVLVGIAEFVLGVSLIIGVGMLLQAIF